MEHQNSIWDVLIIGAGPAGCTAAIYAARAGLHPLLLEEMAPGGQMNLTNEIQNYPGTGGCTDGYTLSQKMHEDAARAGAVTIYARVNDCQLHTDPKKLLTDQGSFLGRTVILAMGAGPRPLNVPEEKRFIGSGLSYCAVCDGMFYKGKTVAVIGGGNSAAAEALYLSGICSEVLLIHRGQTLRAGRQAQQSISRAKNIRLLLNREVIALLGTDCITGLSVRDLHSGAVEQLSCGGVFAAVGRVPNSSLCEAYPVTDSQGYLLTNDRMETTLQGVYAAGDIRAKPLRQIITAASYGALAAFAAEQYLRGSGE